MMTVMMHPTHLRYIASDTPSEAAQARGMPAARYVEGPSTSGSKAQRTCPRSEPRAPPPRLPVRRTQRWTLVTWTLEKSRRRFFLRSSLVSLRSSRVAVRAVGSIFARRSSLTCAHAHARVRVREVGGG